ncbi:MULTISPECIES: hypothetical protein [unclassified Bradyrhizobium]|uniref:hypothetical protein n=1 Tax=unclassified Bradyrhizobium TaxID=2631580 RepID=UPI0028ED32E2|nr:MULTISPECIES: hypothetical protein [unclassified Bradyrhizobium]
MAFPSYSTGTVAVANGATVIDGTGTIWSGVNVRAGDDIVIAGHTVIVEDVTDETHLVIDAWPYTTVTAGTAYKIVQRSPLRFAGGQAMADVSALVAILNGMGTIYAVTGEAPDPSIGEDGQYALKTNTGLWKLWLKVAGVWVAQGNPAGTSTNRGAWDSVTDYIASDMVSRLGSSYIAKAPSTNKPPESNPLFWDLVAGKGDPGSQGPQGAPGTAATITISSTTTLPAGSNATVTNLGTSSAASLALGIPQGAQGAQGVQGLQGQGLSYDASGTLAERATYDGQTTGYAFLQTDVSPFRLWVKASNTSADWAGPTPIGASVPVLSMGSIADPVIATFSCGSIA